MSEAEQKDAQSVDELEEDLPSTSAAIHELTRRDGEKEINRDVMALLWSAIAGGMTMSTSMIARGILTAYLPDSDIGFLFDAAGYTIGFILVIVANQQLFTENTLTPVLPFMSEPTLRNFGKLMRIWGTVFLGNMIGCAIAVWFITVMPVFDDKVSSAFLKLGTEMMANSPLEMFAKGVMAGWLIATLVWMLHRVESGHVLVIFIVTYIIAIGGFTHIIVGAVEAMYLWAHGGTDLRQAIVDFALPTLIGNMVGGTLIFALMSHVQVKSDE
ncbi:formate/nitrite transporter family protein [Rhizobium halophytocola]|uniref:Formate/nitrite transporter FocA (FNT family) n=1 Tax=Rhizobium halophytocola TaxID=735519 RepID=A0ABS4DZY3_9HYPH|nr:formate/nitrite transporter family protein [Rhizobium halophytocola]MBP1851209.1 formate/nitrite transporter FocA (FNT family) [Rhizobium halophytocola]